MLGAAARPNSDVAAQLAPFQTHFFIPGYLLSRGRWRVPTALPPSGFSSSLDSILLNPNYRQGSSSFPPIG